MTASAGLCATSAALSAATAVTLANRIITTSNGNNGNICPEVPKYSLLMLLPATILGVAVVCGSLGLIGKIGYDYFKHSSPKQNIQNVERVNLLDIRVSQRDSGINTIKYIDKKPFGSLDEIVRVNQGEPEILRVGDKGFNEYMQSYNKDVSYIH